MKYIAKIEKPDGSKKIKCVEAHSFVEVFEKHEHVVRVYEVEQQKMFLYETEKHERTI